MSHDTQVKQEVPERIWLPTSAVQLVAVSPELKEVEGDYWVPESALAIVRREAFMEAAKIVRSLSLRSEKHPNRYITAAAFKTRVECALEASASEEK